MNIFRALVFVSIFLNFAIADSFKSSKLVELQKDEFKQYMIRYDQYEKLFQFRWTLYVNNGLVVLSSYEKFPTQYVLALGYRNNSFKTMLRPKMGRLKAPYILVQFVKFDKEKKTAQFKVLVSDDQEEIKIEEIKQKKRD